MKSIVLLIAFTLMISAVAAINPSEEQTTLSVETEMSTTEDQRQDEASLDQEEDLAMIEHSHDTPMEDEQVSDSESQDSENKEQVEEQQAGDPELEDFWFRRRRRRVYVPPRPSITVDNVWKHLQAIEKKCKIPEATRTRPYCRQMVELTGCPRNLSYFHRVVQMRRHCWHLPEVKAVWKIATSEPLASCKYRCKKKKIASVPRSSYFIPTETKLRNRVIPVADRRPLVNRGVQVERGRIQDSESEQSDDDDQQGMSQDQLDALTQMVDEHNESMQNVDRGMINVDSSDEELMENVTDENKGVLSWFMSFRKKGWWKCWGY